MACLKSLKYDINRLKEIFTNDHKRFRIVKTSSDQLELTCLFIGESDKEYNIYAVIPVNVQFYYISEHKVFLQKL